MKDFFISYNRKDRQAAEWIAWTLEEEGGYTTVLQAWDFRPGTNFVLQMDEASRETNRTLSVLSRHYLKDAKYSQAEWAAALRVDPTGQKGKLVPVRIDDCEPTGLLASIAYIDLLEARRSGDEAAAREQLLSGVHRGRVKPPTPPQFFGVVERSVATKPDFPAMRERIRRDTSLNQPDKSFMTAVVDATQLDARAKDILDEMSGNVSPQRLAELNAEMARLQEERRSLLSPFEPKSKSIFDMLKDVTEHYNDRLPRKPRRPK